VQALKVYLCKLKLAPLKSPRAVRAAWAQKLPHGPSWFGTQRGRERGSKVEGAVVFNNKASSEMRSIKAIAQWKARGAQYVVLGRRLVAHTSGFHLSRRYCWWQPWKPQGAQLNPNLPSNYSRLSSIFKSSPKLRCTFHATPPVRLACRTSPPSPSHGKQ